MQQLSFFSFTNILVYLSLQSRYSKINAFLPTTNLIRSNVNPGYSTQLGMESNEDETLYKTPTCIHSTNMNRRSSLFNMFKTTTTAVIIMTTASPTVLPTAAIAKSGSSTSSSYGEAEQDKQKIVKGYKRLEYLLSNWEKETTICKRNDNPYQGCDRTPEKVMEVCTMYVFYYYFFNFILRVLLLYGKALKYRKAQTLIIILYTFHFCHIY